jgi:predicted small lipoprotein YifL
MSTCVSFTRAALVAGLIVLGLSACGRRGALQPPPDGSATSQTEEKQDATEQSTLPSPVGTPRSKATRGYTVPHKPFILDPLL